MICCEKCGCDDVKIVERKDLDTKKVLVDFIRCNGCQHIQYIEEEITKRDLKKQRSVS